jgi:hypothetical protein
MFGQGFYSTMLGASEVRIKTSKGNETVLSIVIKPIYKYDDPSLNNNPIIDFDIDWQETQEMYTGTTIERVDENTGMSSNLIAMLAVNQLQKHVGAVNAVRIMFNGNLLLKEGGRILIQSIDVDGLGKLEVLKISDEIPRLMKDSLYVKEIDDELLSCFPDWIVNIIRNQKLCINLPSAIALNKTRNDVMHLKQVYRIVQPYLFKMIIEYVLNQFCHHNLRIPMLPEDYLYNERYRYTERYDEDVNRLA